MEKIFNCILHGYSHGCPFGWRYREWETQNGKLFGWGCTQPGELTYPEFVPQSVKDDRVKFAPDMLQSHRGGQLSREYVETYPDRVKGMLKAGVITKDEVRTAKPVWNEVKGWERAKKIDSVDLVKKI